MNDLIKTAAELLDWEVYTEVSQALTKINKHDIQGELTSHPSIYSYYASLRDKAKAEHDRANHAIHEYVALKKYEIAENPPAGKRLTDKYLESLVEKDAEYNRLCRSAISKGEFYNLLKSLTNSLEHKKDCLVQMSANSRAEIKLSSL